MHSGGMVFIQVAWCSIRRPNPEWRVVNRYGVKHSLVLLKLSMRPEEVETGVEY